MNGKLVLELRHVPLAVIFICVFYSLTILPNRRRPQLAAEKNR